MEARHPVTVEVAGSIPVMLASVLFAIPTPTNARNKMKLNDEQTLALARKIVDCWDMETLVSYGIESLYVYYHDNPNEAESQMKEMEWDLNDIESLENG